MLIVTNIKGTGDKKILTIVDTTSKEVRKFSEDDIIFLLGIGRMFLGNVEIKNKKLRGKGGDIKKLYSDDGVVIISKLTSCDKHVGYKIALASGKIVRMSGDELLKLHGTVVIQNGAFVKKGSTVYIKAIEGEFATENIKNKKEMNNKEKMQYIKDKVYMAYKECPYKISESDILKCKSTIFKLPNGKFIKGSMWGTAICSSYYVDDANTSDVKTFIYGEGKRDSELENNINYLIDSKDQSLDTIIKRLDSSTPKKICDEFLRWYNPNIIDGTDSDKYGYMFMGNEFHEEMPIAYDRQDDRDFILDKLRNTYKSVYLIIRDLLLTDFEYTVDGNNVEIKVANNFANEIRDILTKKAQYWDTFVDGVVFCDADKLLENRLKEFTPKSSDKDLKELGIKLLQVLIACTID